MIEIRADDLRFSFVEAAGFLNQILDFDLAEADLAALEKRISKAQKSQDHQHLANHGW
jgi:ATP/maltotriose-dependent transcriptional regulator MalT